MKRRTRLLLPELPDDELLISVPYSMVGTAHGVTVEEPKEPTPGRLVLWDGRPIPRRAVGFRPPEARRG